MRFRGSGPIGVLFVATVALSLSGCGDDSPESEPDPTTTTGSTTTTTSTPAPPTTFPPAEADALRDAVIDYEVDQGLGTTFFEVRNLLLSSVDPSWARFNVAPSRGNEVRVQGGYGVAHFDGTRWNIVDFGTADVGCAPVEVPEPVRQSLQLGCAPG